LALPGWHGLLELGPGRETSRANASEHWVAALAVKATSRVLDQIGRVAGQQALRDLVEGIRVPRCTQVEDPDNGVGGGTALLRVARDGGRDPRSGLHCPQRSRGRLRIRNVRLHRSGQRCGDRQDRERSASESSCHQAEIGSDREPDARRHPVVHPRLPAQAVDRARWNPWTLAPLRQPTREHPASHPARFARPGRRTGGAGQTSSGNGASHKTNESRQRCRVSQARTLRVLSQGVG
jgi:hypothetical protein